MGVYAAVDTERSGPSTPITALGPYAIGMAVFVAHLSTIPITGTGINPARSFGPAAVYGDWTDQWIFWVGPFFGAFLAALFYEGLFRGRKNFEAMYAEAEYETIKPSGKAGPDDPDKEDDLDS